MNQHPPHIRLHNSKLILLTLFFLLAAVQSQAQRHKKHHHARHAGTMPDSVSTENEEIQPFVDTVRSTTGSSGDTTVTIGSVTPDITSQEAEGTQETRGTELVPVLRSVPGPVINDLKKNRDFRYATDSSLWTPEQEKHKGNAGQSLEKFFSSKGFKYFIYLLLGSVLLFAFYKIIAENNFRLFIRRPVRVNETPMDEAALPESDLDQLLRKAIDEKAFRPATRYYYLKTLRMLEHRQMIRWHLQTTDEEYARQLDTLSQGEGFRRLMGAYERVWYGKFPLNESQFARLSQYFQDFYISIGESKRA